MSDKDIWDDRDHVGSPVATTMTHTSVITFHSVFRPNSSGSGQATNLRQPPTTTKPSEPELSVVNQHRIELEAESWDNNCYLTLFNCPEWQNRRNWKLNHKSVDKVLNNDSCVTHVQSDNVWHVSCVSQVMMYVWHVLLVTMYEWHVTMSRTAAILTLVSMAMVRVANMNYAPTYFAYSTWHNPGPGMVGTWLTWYLTNTNQ